MEIFIFWLIFSLVVGFIGSNRKIGFWAAFLLSLLLSPLLGLIIALVSKSNDSYDYENKVLKNQNEQNDKLSKIAQNSAHSISEELKNLKLLREQNEITEEEFQKLRRKTINS
ncbi:SHOCT domain-containing protein [Gramella sp. BOM4]|nr:SHOCT domain-containing protein [Christiangramia bathymodioli]